MKYVTHERYHSKPRIILTDQYGGLGLPQLEQFEQKGAREYTQIAAFCEKENLMQHFYTPSSQFIVDGN